MEVSRSVTKRSVSANSQKSHYDDVFGSRKKIGIPVQTPRREDYSEIFGGFHASRSSSIPVLHIPVLAGDSGLHFDARGPSPDYAEVFGKVGGSAFTASFQDVFHYKGSSTSVQRWSISEELDPLGRSGKSNRLPNGDPCQLTGRAAVQLSASQSSPSGRHKELVCSNTSHIANIHDPGYGLAYNTGSISSTEEYQPCPLSTAPGIRCRESEPSGRLKHNHMHCSGSERWEIDSQSWEKLGNPNSMTKQPFFTLTDISLQTKPSRVPPPSRAPPGFTVTKCESMMHRSQRKTSDAAIDMSGGDDLVFLDVEVDESGKKRENKFVKVVHADTLGSREGKDLVACNVQTHLKSISPAIVDFFEDEEFLHSRAPEGVVSRPFAEDEHSLRKCSAEAMCYHKQNIQNSTNYATWREMEEYFEVTEKKVWKHPANAVEDYDASHPEDAYLHQKGEEAWEFGGRQEYKDFKLTKETPRYNAERNLPGYNPPKRTPSTCSIGENGFRNLKQDQPSSEEIPKELTRGKSHTFGKSVKVEMSGDEAVGALSGADKDLGVNVWEGLISWISDTHLQREECQIEPRVVEKRKSFKVDRGDELRKNEQAEGVVSLKEARNKQIQHNKLEGNTSTLDYGQHMPHITMGHENSGTEVAPRGHSMGKLAPSSEKKESESDIGETLEQAAKYETQRAVLENAEFIDHTGDPWKSKGDQTEFFEAKETLKLSADFRVQNLEETGAIQNSLQGIEVHKSIATPTQEANTDLNMVQDVKAKEYVVSLQKDGKPQNYESYRIARKNLESNFLLERHISVCGSMVVDSNILKDQSFSTSIITEQQKNFSPKDNDCREIKGDKLTSSIDIRKSPAPHVVMKEYQESGKNVYNAPPVPENSNAAEILTTIAMDQSSERKHKSIRNSVLAGGFDSVATVVGESELISDYKRKMEEDMERQREREKDRMGVSMAALEARARPYSESLERVALERANAEMKDRSSTGRVGVDKSSVEARAKPDHVAVERANNGAWQWVSERSFSENASDSKGHMDKSFADRRSASVKCGDSGYSSLPSDLHFHSAGAWGFSSEHDGANGESFQRCKARLERYRRTEERVANALAEKNRRDLLVQTEKEERSKVAVGLDAEVKRWSNGKEGNLRALLSTLQYILGPESGWHPIPLTEVVTPAAVKKAYRKATLCVHPDKLQQRGATVQQKYICEKVFDLLKEAWNKFNSGEY